jgi:hypothetical protein
MGEPGSGGTGPAEEKSPARRWIALGLLAAISGLAWKTIGPGKIRSVVLLLLLMFVVRILLAPSHPR